MFHPGSTRSANQADHLLHTPDAFVRAPLPGMVDATAIVHIAPARGARFTQYTVEFGANGNCVIGPSQAFVYVTSGSIQVNRMTLGPDQFAYLPPGAQARVTAKNPATAIVIEKPFVPLGQKKPSAFHGDERKLAAAALNGDERLLVRQLFPEGATYDFAVNTMTYHPGASLSQVEIHVMEHGLIMLDGEGIYRLGDRWYPVQAGDFIWMAPYCPQWFGALGRTPARYLIYKDWNRHP